MRLTKSSAVVRNDSFIDAEVGNEFVIMNPDTGACYGLDQVGARIWTLIAEPQRIDTVCATLTSEYRVDDATCEVEVLDLLEELLAEGMIAQASR